MSQHAEGADNAAVDQPASQVAAVVEIDEVGLAAFFDEDDDEDNYNAQDIQVKVDET